MSYKIGSNGKLIPETNKDFLSLSSSKRELFNALVEQVASADALLLEVSARRESDAAIRELIDAYPEHTTLEAVRRVFARMNDAERERDEARDALETCTEANHILVDASQRLTSERDEALQALDITKRKLEEALDNWDKTRRELDALKRELDEAFNSGDGAYRP